MAKATKNQKTLLVIEDDPGIQSQLRWSFDHYEVVIAGTRNEGVAAIRRYEPPVVLLDLGLPPDPENASEGMAALQEILSIAPLTKVVVVTGNDDRSNAVQAIASGAYDFYQKPIDPTVLGLIVDRANHVFQLEKENQVLRLGVNDSPLDGVIANSPQMLKVCKMVEKIAPADVTTLILGESGTGKEVIAKALHQLSLRKDAPFVAINCAAIPEALLESELFGHEKGAFTGAVKQTLGKVEVANGGTLFLDEIGDMPAPLQAKLLRFLQERKIERIGGRKEISVDVRVVCATHQNLKVLIEQGAFREDLFYRISEITLQLPPLRERSGDAMLLAHAFLRRFASQYGRSLKGMSPDAALAVENYAWPGNIRELENSVKRAVVLAQNSMVTSDDLGLETASDDVEIFNLRSVREAAERQAIVAVLSINGGNISQTADRLGVSRPTLYDLMKKYDLK